MRIAVSLPSLSAAAIERHQIEAAIHELAALADVEVFGESTRLREGELPATGHHYLRLPERHAAAPFDAALHPIGRDFRPYEPSVLLSRRLPSVVWLLDTTAHHVLVGALAGYARWDRYGEILEQQRQDGAAVAATVAAGWGTRALFRVKDPLPVMCAERNTLIAATDDIAKQLGADIAIVPLPASPAELRPISHQIQTVRRVAIVAPNVSWPAPELRALAAVLAARPNLEASYHVIKVLEPGIRHAAAAAGVGDRVEWVVEDGVDRRRELADTADVVVATTGDPTLNDRGLVYRAMAAGQVVVVMRAPAWDSLPSGAAIVVEPGREREAGLRATLLALVDDAELAKGIGAAAAMHSAGVGARETASLLLEHLRASSAGQPLQLRRTGASALSSARSLMVDYCMPHNASQATRGLIGSRIDGILPDAAGPRAWRQ